jgi:hypothetical protein
MDIDMGRFRTNNSMMGTQCRSNHSQVSLGTANQKVYCQILCSAKVPDGRRRQLTQVIFRITRLRL